MKRHVPFCIILVLLLTACSRPAPSSSLPASVSAPVMQEETVEPEKTPLQLVTPLYGMGYETAADHGYYRFASNSSDASASGSGNVFYTDFATRTEIALCNRPDCTHSDESCTSWFPYRGGKLFMNADQTLLFCIASTGSPADPQELWRMNPDGSGRKLLYTCQSGEDFTDAVASDGDNLYLAFTTADGSDADNRKKLLRVNTETGEAEQILSYGLLESVMGAFDDVLVISGLDLERSMFHYSLFSVETGETTELFSYENDGGSEVLARPSGAFLYIVEQTDEERAEIRKMDLRTGETQTLCADFPCYGEDSIQVNGFMDGKMCVSLSDTRANDPTQIKHYQYWVDCETGEATQTTLTYQQGAITMFVSVLAEYGGDFFVQRGTQFVPIMLTGTDGTAYESSVESPVYAMIAKSDYYAGNPAYQDVTPAPLPGA